MTTAAAARANGGTCAVYGDPGQVTGASVPLSAADGDITDWAIGGSKWLTLSGAAARAD